MSTASAWSRPYCGVSHRGQFGIRNWWVTVRDHGTFAILLCWFPGCGFSPHETLHGSATEARAAGDAWLEVNDPGFGTAAPATTGVPT